MTYITRNSRSGRDTISTRRSLFGRLNREPVRGSGGTTGAGQRAGGLPSARVGPAGGDRGRPVPGRRAAADRGRADGHDRAGPADGTAGVPGTGDRGRRLPR